MKLTTTMKSWLKIARWQARRLQAAGRWGAERLRSTPAVLGNAMPKSGSHLIIQVLQGLTGLGPFINTGFPPVNRDEENSKLSPQAILKNIEHMRSGDLAYGYLAAREPFISALTRPGRAMVFVYRDPRDMVISQVFYATEMHAGHGMHRYYTETLHTMEERINAAIQGVSEPGSELSSMHQRWDNYFGWLEMAQDAHSPVLTLRFEDLILERHAALGRLLDYLAERGFTPQPPREQAIQALTAAILPKKSGTFRKGKPGNWQEHFTEANKTLFKEVTGDLLVRLGYEQDSHW